MEQRDKVVRFAGVSISNYSTSSVTASGFSANGYILSGGFQPTRVFNPNTLQLADIRNILATLVMDTYGPTG